MKKFFLLPLIAVLSGCTAIQKQIKDINPGSIMEAFGIYADTDATNENEFETVQFEKALNREFQSSLGTKKIHFIARYQGTVPYPDKFKGVEGFTNVNLCSPNNSSVCSDLVVIKNDKADSVFSLSPNQKVDVFGVLTESSGMTNGSITVSVKSPYKHFRIFKIRTAGAKPASTSTPSQSSTENSFVSTPSTKSTDPQVYAGQLRLKALGYNPGKPDGLFGSKTKVAIEAFQKDIDIPITGQFDQQTLDALGL